MVKGVAFSYALVSKLTMYFDILSTSLIPTGHNGSVHSIHCEKGILLSCDTTGVVSEKDFWSCVVEGPGNIIMTLLNVGSIKSFV